MCSSSPTWDCSTSTFSQEPHPGHPVKWNQQLESQWKHFQDQCENTLKGFNAAINNFYGLSRIWSRCQTAWVQTFVLFSYNGGLILGRLRLFSIGFHLIPVLSYILFKGRGPRQLTAETLVSCTLVKLMQYWLCPSDMQYLVRVIKS